ncbi:MAG: diacylglycerol/lipid kinase family protein [Candidatus Dormibacteraceae bacterium]
MTGVLVIVNPAADGGRTGRRWPGFAVGLRAAGVDFEAAFTTRPGEAAEISRRAVSSARGIVLAAGGDGTLNEVVNGFFEGGEAITTESVLGMIPLGSGGDFRRSFGLPSSPGGVARLLREGAPRRIDAGRATFRGHGGATAERYFINIADAGIGGEVVARVNRSSKRLGGAAAFLMASMASVLTWRNQPMRVTAGGRSMDLVAQQVVIANGRYFGGGMQVAPRAAPDDGLLDVLLVGDLGLWENARGLRRLRSGTHLDDPDPKLEFFRTARVEVDSTGRVPLDLDGEQPGTLPAVFEVVPGAISLLAPPAGRE